MGNVTLVNKIKIVPYTSIVRTINRTDLVVVAIVVEHLVALKLHRLQILWIFQNANSMSKMFLVEEWKGRYLRIDEECGALAFVSLLFQDEFVPVQVLHR